MKLKNKHQSLIGLGILTFSAIFGLVTNSLLAQERVAQKDTVAQNTADDKKYLRIDDKTLNTEPVQVVREYWRLAEAGDLKEAVKLTTNKYKDFGFEVKSDSRIKEREEIIYNSGDSLATVEQIKVVADDKWQIGVKVRRKIGKSYYLFHTLVKNGDKWKIFATFH